MGKLRAILEPEEKWDEVIKVDQTALKKLASGLPFATQKMIEETKELKRETQSLTLKKRSSISEDEE